jgi:hypothetical protein
LSLSIRMRSCASPSRPSAARSSRPRCTFAGCPSPRRVQPPPHEVMMTAEAATAPGQDALRDDRATTTTSPTTDHVGTTHIRGAESTYAHLRFVISISSRTSSATGAPTRESRADSRSQAATSARRRAVQGLWKGRLALPRSARPPTRVL